MKLETNRLIIIPCTEKSLTLTKYEIGPHIHLHLEKHNSDPTINGWGPWLLLDKENYEAIGDVGFKGKPNKENTVEVGYGILPQFQNRGYATEAVKEVIKWAFSSGNVDRVVAECLVDNLASIKVLEKLGMRKIGAESNLIKWQLIKKM